MAGDERHNAMLREKYPDAFAVECDGTGSSATVRHAESGPDSYPMRARCPGCERDRITSALAAFTPPRFRAPVLLPPQVTAWASCGRDAQGLYLSGPVGTGKTQAAWGALAAWCTRTGIAPEHETRSCWDTRIAPTAIFTRMTDLLDDLRPGDDARQRVRDCQRVALLVIDDLGAEKPSEWTQERLYSIIDHRYANCMPLIVTSNLPPKELAAQTGERTASRLAEMCTVVPVTGADRRRPAS